MDRGMVIVGAGECGARAALALRDNGYAGSITLIGNEAHLPYERPPLSKAVLAGEPPTIIATEEKLAAAGIVRLHAAATAIDQTDQRVIAGEAVPYDKLLLATGARPRTLSQPGVLYLRDMDDCVALRARLAAGTRIVIIGGGFLGLEIAAAARGRGAQVAVVEAQARILQRGVPAEIAAVVAARHAAAGVTIRTGVAIASVDAGGITLADGTRLDAEVVLASVGAMPNTELAEGCGLETANGILVDVTLRSSDAAIFAAGDCCAFPLPIYGNRIVRLESWRSAGEHSALAARNMLGTGEPVSAIPWFWSDQYDLTLQVAGLYDAGQSTVRRDIGAGAFLLFHHDDSGRLVAASGIGPGNAIARDIKLAERLIARSAYIGPDQLADPSVGLKSLLSATG